MAAENFNDWSDQDIAHAYEQGASMKTIATKLGIAPETVGKILRRMNVEIRSSAAARRGTPRPPRKLPHDAIMASYQAGSSTRDLAKEYDASPETIRRILIKHNIPLRAAHQAIATTANYRQPMTDEQRAEAVELYKQGLSASQVAKQMGFASKRTILNVVNAAGVTRPGTRGIAEEDLQSPTMQEIAKRFQAGESVLALSKRYGVPRSTLQRRLQALGLLS